MKTVKIENKQPNYYNAPAMYMSFVDEVVSDTEMVATNTMTDCREIFVMRLMERLKGIKYLVSSCKKHLSKLRLVFYKTNLDPEMLLEALTLLHSIEDKYNIPRTEVSKAEIWKYKMPTTQKEKPKRDCIMPTAYLFEANAFWMRSSVLISLYLLILRFSIVNFRYLKKNELMSVEALKKFLADNNALHNFRDGTNVYTTIKHWEKILDNVDTIFPPQKNLKNYFLQKMIYNGKPSPGSDSWAGMVGCFGIRNFISDTANKNYKKFKAYQVYHKQLLN